MQQQIPPNSQAATAGSIFTIDDLVGSTDIDLEATAQSNDLGNTCQRLREELNSLTGVADHTGKFLTKAHVITHQFGCRDKRPWAPKKIKVESNLVNDANGKLAPGVCQALADVVNESLPSDIFPMFSIQEIEGKRCLTVALKERRIPVEQPASQPASLPASQPASQPASLPPSLPASLFMHQPYRFPYHMHQPPPNLMHQPPPHLMHQPPLVHNMGTPNQSVSFTVNGVLITMTTKQ